MRGASSGARAKGASSGARAKGALTEVGDGCFAYLQLPGSWGYSNSGLVCSGDQALVVDTLYDTRLTADMLREYRRVSSGATLDTVVNTHANGDHCWGNQLLPQAQIISSRAAAAEMAELSPKLMQLLVHASRACVAIGAPASALLGLLGRLGVPRAASLACAAPFIASSFGDFDFGAVRLRAPDRTFEGELTLAVGDKQVQLFEVGPAHTSGDVIAYVAEDRTVFTGDILFEQSHPVIWDGPIENWIAACERIEALDVDTVVPGHGPLTTTRSLRTLRSYLVDLRAGARRAYDDGVSAHEAAMALRKDLMPQWSESERLVANMITLYRQFSGERAPIDPLEMLAHMARMKA